MKQSQWTFEVHNCSCFSQVRAFQQTVGNYRMVISQRHSTETFTALQNKTKHATTETNESLKWLGHMT